MQRSPGLRFVIVGLLVLLMSIPVAFVGEVIDKRADYNRQARTSVGQEWGGSQLLSGPMLVIPVQETITVREKIEALDPVTGIQLTDENETKSG